MIDKQGNSLSTFMHGSGKLPVRQIPIFHQVADAAHLKTGDGKFLADPGHCPAFHVLAKAVMGSVQHGATPGCGSDPVDRDECAFFTTTIVLCEDFTGLGNIPWVQKKSGSACQLPTQGLNAFCVADSEIAQNLALGQTDIEQIRAGTCIGPGHAEIEDQGDISPPLAQPPGKTNRCFKHPYARNKKLVRLAGLFFGHGQSFHLCGSNKEDHRCL